MLGTELNTRHHSPPEDEDLFQQEDVPPCERQDGQRQMGSAAQHERPPGVGPLMPLQATARPASAASLECLRCFLQRLPLAAAWQAQTAGEERTEWSVFPSFH